jgi:hypothetical protein
MLPYRLRPPIYGKKLEHLKQTAEHVQARGGPVQRAIEEDLSELEKCFLEEHQAVDDSSSHHHVEPGKTFRSFKQVFGSRRVALVHLLVPTTKCDREAYAQLIYAACLERVRIAFQPPFDLEHAAAALYALYALQETNPLPSTTPTPMQLLPLAMQSKDNPRALFRRAFRQPIRIDQEHYALLLQLRELALARCADCRQALYYQKKKGRTAPWTCSCGIAKDSIEVLNRLLPHLDLDLCEYTGPIGMEALAGHADYLPPASSSNATARAGPAIPPPLDDSTPPPPPEPPFRYSNDLFTAMDEYDAKIKAIRLPPGKAQKVNRLRKTLVAVIPSNAKESWTDAKARLLEGAIKSKAGPSNNTKRTQPTDRTTQPITTQNQEARPPRHQWNNGDDKIENGENQHGLPYQLTLSEGISSVVQKYLETSFQRLLQRDGSILFPTIETQPIGAETPLQAADDVSSIGVGGVSVATGQGRAALQALLSKASTRRRVPTAIPHRPSPDEPMVHTPGALFLRADRGIDSYAMPEEDDDDDDDDASEVSNLSDDGEEDDMASAATSAAGRRALELLLSKVVSTRPKKATSRKRRISPTRTRQAATSTNRRPTQTNTDNASVASSVGQGRAALDALLKRVTRGNQNGGNAADAGTRTKRARTRSQTGRTTTSPSEKPKKAPRTVPKPKTVPANANSAFEEENDSMAPSVSTVGAGRAALTALLSTTNAPQPESESEFYQSREDASEQLNDDDMDASVDPVTTSKRRVLQDSTADNASVASSVGPGRAALDALLTRVTRSSQNGDNSTKAGTRKKRGKKGSQTGRKITSTRERPKKAPRTVARPKAAPAKPTSALEEDSVSSPLEENDSMAPSVSTVGAGRAALTALLSTATVRQPEPESVHSSDDNSG